MNPPRWSRALWQDKRWKMSTEPYRIDVHQHVLPPEYVSALARLGITGGGGRPFPTWDVKSTLELMDRHGIVTAITSLSEPGVYFGDRAFARDLARRCNEYAARLVQEYPLDTLKLDGVILLSSIEGTYPGDPAFDELFAELNRRRAVVFLHPTVPAINAGLKLILPPFLFEFAL